MRSWGPDTPQFQLLSYCAGGSYLLFLMASQVTLSHQLTNPLDPLRTAVLTYETIPSEES